MFYYNLIKFVLILDKIYRYSSKSEKITFLLFSSTLALNSNESYS